MRQGKFPKSKFITNWTERLTWFHVSRNNVIFPRVVFMAISLSERLIGKKLRVTLNDGTWYEGVCKCWTPAVDDPDDRENIDIEIFKNNLIECYGDEIASIESL